MTLSSPVIVYTVSFSDKGTWPDSEDRYVRMALHPDLDAVPFATRLPDDHTRFQHTPTFPFPVVYRNELWPDGAWCVSCRSGYGDIGQFHTTEDAIAWLVGAEEATK
mgnify:CR=1 FL=1